MQETSMSTRVRIAAAAGILGVLGIMTPVSANPATEFTAAQHICEAAGGTFFPDATSYGCLGPLQAQGASPAPVRVCENIYNMTFADRPSGYV